MADADGVTPKPKRSRTRSRPREEAPDTPDPVDIAMKVVASGADRHGAAHAVLEKHACLIDIQCAREKEELAVLRVKRVTRWLILLATAGLLAALGALLWNASRADALVVEPLRAPPDLAARGLDGTTLAQKLLDGLSDMHARTETIRTGGSIQNDWGDDLNVAIPQTGISMGEAWRLLRRWLGEETRVTGELVRGPAGEIIVTVRANANPGQSFSGPEAEIDALIRRAAEAVFAASQPYRYASYLRDETGRGEEARAVFTRLTTHPDPRERPWGWIGLTNIARHSGDLRSSTAYARRALALEPELSVGHNNLAINAELLGHSEALAAALEAALRSNPRQAADDEDAARIERVQIAQSYRLKAARGGFGDALDLRGIMQRFPPGWQGFYWYNQLAGVEVGAHEPAAAAASLAQVQAQPLGERPDRAMRRVELARGRIAVALERDSPVAIMLALAEAAKGAALAAGDGDAPRLAEAMAPTRLWPMQARALARLRRIAEARALAERMPHDCYPCLIVGGEIEAAAGDAARAEGLFAEAARLGPSLPFAHEAWARMLARRGDYPAALAQLRVAARGGPRWADPLKLQGDILAWQRKDGDAIRKYRAAAERAPRWGALHIEWAKALWRSGDRDEARAKFRAAARMDLSDADRARLKRISALAAGA